MFVLGVVSDYFRVDRCDRVRVLQVHRLSSASKMNFASPGWLNVG